MTAATHHPGATVLSPRGALTWADVDGPLEKSAIAPRKTPGEQKPNGYLAAIGKPGPRMARIAPRPRRVRVLEFSTRVPGRTPKIARDAPA